MKSEHYVPLEQAKQLKELGFKERVLTYYENGKPKLHDHISGWDYNSSFLTCVSRPTFTEVFDWFQDKYTLFPEVYHTRNGYMKDEKMNDNWKPDFWWKIYKPVGITYAPKFINDQKPIYSYEEAKLACLKALIKLI